MRFVKSDGMLSSGQRIGTTHTNNACPEMSIEHSTTTWYSALCFTQCYRGCTNFVLLHSEVHLNKQITVFGKASSKYRLSNALVTRSSMGQREIIIVGAPATKNDLRRPYTLRWESVVTISPHPGQLVIRHIVQVQTCFTTI